jgi:Tfp pilus assembly pilus retraction ATPase PilT
VTEVLIVNKQVKNAIRDRNYNELANLMETKQNGSSSYTMNSELADAVKDKQITQEAALAASYDPEELRLKIGAIKHLT